MAWNLTIAYLAVALVTTVLVFLASDRLGDERRPFAQRILLSMAAGLVWPVLLLGAAEIGSVAVYAKVRVAEHEDHAFKVLA